MKELSIEEKAKRYDEAIEKAEKWYNAPNVDKIPIFGNRIIEDIFPELKESEDEQIRKELIDYLKERKSGESYGQYVLRYDRWINWLEKQGEQEITDKVEPKFHEGNWVIDKQGIVHQISNVIENVTNHTYGYDIVGGGYFNDNTEGVRLWTIKDAEDGDVLAGKIDGDNYVLIYKRIKDGWIETYGHYYDSVNRFCAPSQSFCRDVRADVKKAFRPATEKQRNLLFAKMKEAGYEWNADKKELKKL